MDLLIICILGSVAGYFLTFWLQVVIVVGMFAYYRYASKDDNGTVAHAHLFFWSIAFAVGALLGDIIYCVSFINFDFSSLINQLPKTKSWFLR